MDQRNPMEQSAPKPRPRFVSVPHATNVKVPLAITKIDDVLSLPGVGWYSGSGRGMCGMCAACFAELDNLAAWDDASLVYCEGCGMSAEKANDEAGLESRPISCEE